MNPNNIEHRTLKTEHCEQMNGIDGICKTTYQTLAVATVKRGTVIRYVAVLVALIGIVFLAARKTQSTLESGEVFEQHVVQGKPTIEIRIFGFVDAGFSAYLVDGRKRTKLFDLLECYSSNFQPATNPVVRQFQGDTIREGVRRLSPPLFGVGWSPDSQRVGIAFNGYFVAAYDRATGRRIQFADYLKRMGVFDRNGGELWHDYVRCDAEIAQFLQ